MALFGGLQLMFENDQQENPGPNELEIIHVLPSPSSFSLLLLSFNKLLALEKSSNE